MAPAARLLRLLQLLCLLCLRLPADCAKAAAAAGTKDPAVWVDLLASSAPRRNDSVLLTPRRNDNRKGHLVVQPSMALVSNTSSLGDALLQVPDHLDAQGAGARLTLPSRGRDLGSVSQERQSPEQAAASLGAVPTATAPYASPPAVVLQRLQGCWAGALPAAELLALAEAVRHHGARLSRPQLSCLAKLLVARNLAANSTALPPDLLLFLNFADVHNQSCKAFYALASQGHLELLPKGSSRRTRLLHGALACLGASGPGLSAEQLGTLGALVCDMGPATITASHPRVLENLKLCPALSGVQRAALNALLLRGAPGYGHPSSWDLRSLQSLGTLVLSLNKTLWGSVAEEVREAFRRHILVTYRGQDRSQRDRSLALLGALASASAPPRRRAQRSVEGCKVMPINSSTLSDPLLILYFDSIEQFNLCLTDEVLKNSLALLLEQPLTMDFLRIVKRRMDKLYPEGIPEEQLKELGLLAQYYTTEEISTWTVTSSDTLLALFKPIFGTWKAPQARQLITRYLDLGGDFTGPLLQTIGGRNLCNLDEEQISCITPEAIGCAGPLDISSCSQAKKNQLYAKAQEAFAGQAGTPAYYSLIQPYLGGAPAEDLKDLAKTSIAMDIDTFTALNPEELQKLSVMDVKNLLGINLPDLKLVENLPAVISWIRRQDQWELDHILGIGLQGGIVKPSPTSSATSVIFTLSATVVPTTAVLATTTLPTGTTINSHTAMGSSSSTHVSPTPSTITPTTPHAHSTLSSTDGSPASTSRFTTRPAPVPSSTSPCSVHPPTTSMTTKSPASTLLTTTSLTTVHPSPISASLPPHSALTGGTTTAPNAATNPWAVTTHNTSTPVVSINPPVPGGATKPAPSTLNTTTPTPVATTAANITSQKPTPIPGTSVSTQKSATSSTVKTTALTHQTEASPPFVSTLSTTTSSETTKKKPTDVPDSQNQTPVGYINLPPEAGSASRLSSCSLHIFTAVLGMSLLQGLL